MKCFSRSLSVLLSLFLLAACAPDSREQGLEVKTTYEPPQPHILDEDGYKVIRGSTRVHDMSVNFDPTTRGMTLKGRIEFLPARSSTTKSVPLDLGGLLDPQGFIALKAQKGGPDLADIKVAAKATCLSADGGCRSSFIDIYVHYQDITYHHQVESIQEEPAAPQEESPEGQEEISEDPELETEGGADDVEGEPGQYVGDIAQDIEKILEIKKPEVKPDQPKKEEPKKEEPKPEAPPVKEEPKAEEPKKDPPPKVEEPKKTPPVKDEPKKEEPKKEEPKPQTPSPALNKVSQAIGPVNNGRLENAMDMLAYEKKHDPAGFTIIRPKRNAHFSTNELGYIVALMGTVTKKNIPGYELAVGDLSRKAGGKLGSHKSHQNGLDADVAFYFDNKSFHGYFASAVAVNKPHANWMMEEQWELFKETVKTQLIDRIFIHGALKKALCEHAIKRGELKPGDTQSLAAQTLRRLIPEQAHHNHFHLRVKCSKAQVRCRQMAEPAQGSGCF